MNVLRRKSRAAKAVGKSKPLKWGDVDSNHAAARKKQNYTDKPVFAKKREPQFSPDYHQGGFEARAGFSPALVRQKLIIFYGTHAPDGKENLDELVDVLLYYISKVGMDSLNTKLKEKYGQSLEDIHVDDASDSEEDDLEPPPPEAADEYDQPPPLVTEDEEFSSDTLRRIKKAVEGDGLVDPEEPPPPPLPDLEEEEEEEPNAYAPRSSLRKSKKDRKSSKTKSGRKSIFQRIKSLPKAL